jgi:anaerobic magnesium-protoporphyrin IX monomethyl ester cyclase
MKTDTLFIGHNEMDFSEYEKNISSMGYRSCAYRDLSLNFIRYNNRPYTAAEVYNLFSRTDRVAENTPNPFDMLETFSPAIAYLGTYLNKRGYTFDYINDFQSEKQKLAQKLMTNDIRTVAIITTLYVSVLPILEVIEFIKKYNRTARIIVGGPFVSTKVRAGDDIELAYLLKSIGADFYVNSSQGETTLVRILESLKNNESCSHIQNIYYKKDSGYVGTPTQAENNKLSENIVNWRLFADRANEYVALRTSISCPFSCSFCGFPEHAGEYQTVNPQKIEEELNQLSAIGTVKSIHFIDDTFNVPISRFKEILRMMIKNRYPFKWHSYFRCQYADEEMVELMKESGCEGVFLGIESGNNTILENMNKTADIDKYQKGIECLHKHNIITFGNFIIGFPGETQETVNDTIAFIEEGKLDFFRVQQWYYEHITPIWKQRERYNLKGESFEWSHSTMDAKTAAEIIEKIFLSVKGPTWLPQYNFDFDNLWHLVHRGMTVQQVKHFLDSFNNGVKEKIEQERSGEQGEISVEKLKQIINACRLSDKVEKNASPEPKEKIHKIEADFSF